MIGSRDSFSISHFVYSILWVPANYYLYIALGLAFTWLVFELGNRPKWLRIATGLATVICLIVYHAAISNILRCEINYRTVALRPIETHLKAGNISEVRRAIRIHNEELDTTEDSLRASESLLHELNRGWD